MFWKSRHLLKAILALAFTTSCIHAAPYGLDGGTVLFEPATTPSKHSGFTNCHGRNISWHGATAG